MSSADNGDKYGALRTAAAAAERRAADLARALDNANRSLAATTQKLQAEGAARVRAEQAARRRPKVFARPQPLRWSELRDAAVIARSDMFDAAFYAAQMPLGIDVGDPVEHYVADGWRLGLNPGPYFHTNFYLAQNPDVAATGRCPLAHYLRGGARELRSPHPLFDARWYAAEDPAARAANPLAHYRRDGAAARLDPHPFFSVRYYLERYTDLAATAGAAFDHFLRKGGAEGRTPHPMFDPDFYRDTYGALDISDPNLLLDFLTAPVAENRQPHGAFDTAWYRAHYAAARSPNTVAAVHYLAEGQAQHLRPNPLFDPHWYFSETKKAAPKDALFTHYLEEGSAAGLRPHPLFDPAHYRAHAPGLMMEPLAHFLTTGGVEGRSPHPLFDTAWYLRQAPDVAAAGAIALVDYLERGSAAGCTPNPVFDPSYYREAHSDLSGSTVDPLSHYAISGEDEGRPPARLFDPAFLRRTKAPVRTLQAYLNHEGPAVSTHPLFDAAFYLARYPDAAASPLKPLAHFMHVGAGALHDCHPLFDAAWYAATYVGEMDHSLSPIDDYIVQGWRKSRRPNPLFDPQWYRAACTAHDPALAADTADTDPLVHYIETGQALRINPHPLFDSRWYAQRHPGADTAPGGALGHFLHADSKDDVAPNALFDAPWYRKRYHIPVNVSPFRHYLDSGARAGARPNPLFDPQWYVQSQKSPPLPEDALAHYIHQGERMGLRPNPHFDPVDYRARRSQRRASATKAAPAASATVAWRRDARAGGAGEHHYVSITALPGDLPAARALAQSLKRHGHPVVRLTILDAPVRPMADADDVFDEVRDIADLPLSKATLFALSRARAVDAAQLAALADLLERADCASVTCLPAQLTAMRSLQDLLAPLASAAACIPYRAIAEALPVFAVRPTKEGVALLQFLQTHADEGIGAALARAPLELPAVRVLDERGLIADTADDAALFVLTQADAPAPWAFDTFDNGVAITDGHRALYAGDASLQKRFPDPFATGEDGGFFAWTNAADGWRDTNAAPTVRHATELAHFIENGRALRLRPTAWFDEAAYLARYPDVRESGMEPFAHYVLFGAREGRAAGQT